MHKLLAAAGARVDAVFVCPHAPEDGCSCRKPEPGLLQQIGQRYGVALADVPAVGDSLNDVRAAADVFRPVYDATGGVDGRVSIEVEPGLAMDTEGTSAQVAQGRAHTAMRASGMHVINPPFTLAAQLREALPFVTEALKDPIGSGWTVESGNY